jgi:hypothetical protein
MYLEAKYAEGDVVVGLSGSSASSSSPPKLCDDRDRASRLRRSFSAMYRLRPVPYLLSESSSSSAGGGAAVLLLLFKKRLV